jgi:predicted Ser/Thr protein kinase
VPGVSSRHSSNTRPLEGRRTIDPELESWLLENLTTEGRVVGRGYQAVVRRLKGRGGDFVVKSPHPNPFLTWLGRRAIRREAEVYDRLSGVPGIPRSFGLAASEHLVLEHIEGRTLRAAAAELGDREGFFARLLSTIESMHAAGVAHGDLKRKENTIVAAGEVPYLIDFGIACVGTEPFRGLVGRRFRTMRQMDLNAWIKLKHGPRPVDLPPEEAALHRPLAIERLARRLREPWKILSLRRLRKRRREKSG